MKAEAKRTRGLNRNLGHTLKAIFKGAATTVIGRAEDDPIYRPYDLPARPGASGRRHETEPGEADPCSIDRIHRAGGMASQGGLRPEETRERSKERLLTRAEAAAGKESLRGVGPGIRADQGRASIGFLVRALGPESPGIGDAPLESRTKLWAQEPPIEGWFPLTSGE
jgi:hypothetical protein